MKPSLRFNQKVLVAAGLIAAGLLLGALIDSSLSVPFIAAVSIGWIGKALIDHQWRQMAFGLALLVGVFAGAIGLPHYALAWGCLAIFIEASRYVAFGERTIAGKR